MKLIFKAMLFAVVATSPALGMAEGEFDCARFIAKAKINYQIETNEAAIKKLVLVADDLDMTIHSCEQCNQGELKAQRICVEREVKKLKQISNEEFGVFPKG